MDKDNFYETERGTTFVLPLNLRHYTGGVGITKTQRGEFLFDSIRCDVRTIGDYLENVGQELTMDQVEGGDVGPMIEMLGRFLLGFAEAQDFLQMEYFHEEKIEEPKAESEPAKDLVKSLAQNLSEALNNPALPFFLRNAIGTAMCEIHSETPSEDRATEDSAEYIESILCDYQKSKGGENG